MPTDQPEKVIDDGGPMFTMWKPRDGFDREQCPGMSVRMWLAGQNHAVCLATLTNTRKTPEDDDARLSARVAFEWADALITEGGKDSPS